MPDVNENEELRRRLRGAVDPAVPAGAESRILQRFHERVVKGRAMPWSRLGGALAGVAVVAVVAGVVAFAVVQRSQPSVAPGGAHATRPSPPPANGKPTPIPGTPTPNTTPLSQAFQPQAVTAVSDSGFWVLGTPGECTPCTPLVMHTSDGGSSFSSIPGPPTSFANFAQGSGASISDLRFADNLDGYAFGPGLWVTHDDGAHWHQVNFGEGSVVQLEPSADNLVYAVVKSCTSGGASCTLQLVRSPATSDQWNAVLTLSGAAGPPPSLGVHGPNVWLMNASDLWRTTDSGATFTKFASPCEADLGGSVDPVTADVVWAFCLTGTQGVPWLSANGGATFRDARGNGSYNNGAMVAATSAATAFVTETSLGPLAVTTDGGNSYSSAGSFPAAVGGWIGFTDSEVGYFLFVDSGGTGSQLWRTSDGGLHWNPVTT